MCLTWEQLLGRAGVEEGVGRVGRPVVALWSSEFPGWESWVVVLRPQTMGSFHLPPKPASL